MKRALDFTLASVGLLLLFPVLLCVAALLHFKMKGVFFRQVRPGKFGKPFEMLKFKTMNNDVDENGALLPDAQRLTSLGSFLRSTSIDELPELWNILKGEMSLVGPRPLLVEYLPLYNKRQLKRHDLRPGLTGWAQINGRNAISWEEKFELDVWYVENQSLKLDLKIIIKTLQKVAKRNGISHQGTATMHKFEGSD